MAGPTQSSTNTPPATPSTNTTAAHPTPATKPHVKGRSMTHVERIELESNFVYIGCAAAHWEKAKADNNTETIPQLKEALDKQVRLAEQQEIVKRYNRAWPDETLEMKAREDADALMHAGKRVEEYVPWLRSSARSLYDVVAEAAE